MASITITQSPVLVSTNVSSSSYTEWAVGTTYSAGNYVKVSKAEDGVTDIFPILEYKASGASTGAYPPNASIDQWVKVGAQNSHAMFDLITDQVTVADAEEALNVSLSPVKPFNRVVLLGIADANKVTIEIVSGGVTVYSREVKLVSYDTPVGWWTYFFRSDNYSYRRSVAFEILEKYANPTINIEITGGEPKCGWCIVGMKHDLGPTEWEAEANPKDYSRFETNEFGVTTFVPRRVVDDVRGTLWVETKDYNRVYSLLRSNMNTLALFDLNNEIEGPYVFDPLRVYGKLESVSGGLSYGVTPLNIKISGLS